MDLTPEKNYTYNLPKNNWGGVIMKGDIYTRQKCSLCGKRLKHNEKKNGCVCPDHPEIRAGKIFVRFGGVFKNFSAERYLEANQFLQGLRFKLSEGSFDIRDYQKDTPLGFEKLGDEWLNFKARPIKQKGRRSKYTISESTLRNYKNYMRRAKLNWGNRNIKTIQEKEIDDFLYGIKKISEKTRHNHRSCLHDFWTWVARREKIPIPDIPEIEYELQFRTISNFEIQGKILDEIFSLSYHINPKIWIGCDMLASYNNLRPQDLLKIAETDIDLDYGIITIHFPTKKKNALKTFRLLDRHIKEIEVLKQNHKGMPHMPFFRHVTGISGVSGEAPFGKKYFYKWWKKACNKLGIEGLDLYGGTRHTTTTEIAKIFGRNDAKQALGNTTNKSMERYCLIQDEGTYDIMKKIDDLKQGRGKIVKFQRK